MSSEIPFGCFGYRSAFLDNDQPLDYNANVATPFQYIDAARGSYDG